MKNKKVDESDDFTKFKECELYHRAYEKGYNAGYRKAIEEAIGLLNEPPISSE